MRSSIALALMTLCMACNSRKEEAIDFTAYRSEINTWHKERLERLKAPRGWLNLTGLYWLKPGINTFGRGSQNDIVFAGNQLPEKAGCFVVNNSIITIEPAPGVDITSHDKPIEKGFVIFHPDSANAQELAYGSLRWNIIKRDDKLGIRLRDLNSPALKDFRGVERFPVDLQWRVEALFKGAPASTTINITNAIGQTTEQPSPGTLIFELKGKTYELQTMEEGEDELFIVFGDVTTGKETYGGGRFLYVKRAGADGKTILDFNKAYNPPCVFTEYATCPLPPVQNILSVAITAGEKNYKHSL